MNKDRLRATLARDEGCNLKRHEVQDIDHIGYGINLENELPDELLDYLGVSDEDDIHEITQEQADYLLDSFVGIAERDCLKIYGETWKTLSALRQEVLINLCFNLGLPRLRAFRKMNAAIQAKDWAEAARQMLDSKAARQTGERYSRLAGTFEHNDERYLQLPERYDTRYLELSERYDTPEIEETATQDIHAKAEFLKSIPTPDLLSELQRRVGNRP